MEIGLMRAQQKYFEQNKEEILRTDARFAMVHRDKVEYFKSREKLYQAYPHLVPGASPTFGNFPMLVDIGERTNSVEYRKEQLEEREKKFSKNLEGLTKEYLDIIKEKEELKN